MNNPIRLLVLLMFMIPFGLLANEAVPAPGLSNGEQRCLLNSLFHALSFGLGSYRNELAAAAERDKNSIVAAYYHDLVGYESCTEPCYTLTALYDVWSSTTNHRKPDVLIPKFVEAWNHARRGKCPSMGSLWLVSADNYQQDGGSWTALAKNSSLLRDLSLQWMNVREVVGQQPEILIISSLFQGAVATAAAGSSSLVDWRSEKLPYAVPLELDLTPYSGQQIAGGSLKYELVGIICCKRWPDGDVHGTSVAKTDRGHWVYMNDLWTEKIAEKDLSRYELPRWVTHTGGPKGCEIGQIFIYQRQPHSVTQ